MHVAQVSSLLHSYVFDVERRTVVGGTSTFERDVVVHPGAVSILAVDHEGRVGVIEQYRASIDKRQWEIPAGTIESHERDPLVVAQRELREKWGVVAADWMLLQVVLASPGWTNQRMHIFLARNLQMVPREPAGEEEQSSRVAWWTVSAVQSFLACREPIDATMTIAFQRFVLDGWANA